MVVKTGSVDGICQQTDSMNRFYLDVKTGPYNGGLLPDIILTLCNYIGELFNIM